MKKLVRVLVVVMIFFAGFSAHAQIFGIKGGVGLANITSPNEFDDGNFGRIFGTRIGGTIEFEVVDNLYIGSGLGFAKKGATTTGDNLNLYYIESPIGARYNIVEVGRSGYFFANAGFNLGIAIAANAGGVSLDIGSQVGDNIKALDFGFNTGVGFIFDERFEVGLQTEFGLVDISATDSSNLKNITLMVTFGYKFGM